MTYSCSNPYFFHPSLPGVSVTWDHPTLGLIAFLATPDDIVPHGVEIYNEAMQGEYGPIVSYQDSHWYSTVDGNEWEGRVYNIGHIMISPTGVQPPNSTNQPLPLPPF